MSTRVAPIFPVSSLVAALAYYRGLGFGVRHWHSGGYGFVTFDGTEIHLGVEPDLDVLKEMAFQPQPRNERRGALWR